MAPKAIYEARKDDDVLTISHVRVKVWDCRRGIHVFPSQLPQRVFIIIKWLIVIAKFMVNVVPLISPSTNMVSQKKNPKTQKPKKKTQTQTFIFYMNGSFSKLRPQTCTFVEHHTLVLRYLQVMSGVLQSHTLRGHNIALRSILQLLMRISRSNQNMCIGSTLAWE